jgi:hypothetical protein
MARENTLSYTVSAKGPTGDWYWEVSSDRNIIARGLAPTSVRARADALKAAVSHLGRQAEDLWRSRGDAFLPLSSGEA